MRRAARIIREAPATAAVDRLGRVDDVVVAPGLSVHVFGKRVGIYSDRIDAGRGFVEMPMRDFIALLRWFANEDKITLDAEREGPQTREARETSPDDSTAKGGD